MTLVAALGIAGHPFLVGDLLISRERRHNSYPSFNTPTLSDINAALPIESTHIAAGLSRKIALLDGRLAIGWSGHQIAAKTVIGDIIKAMNSADSFDYERLIKLLDSVDYLGMMELSLCGMMTDDRGVRVFCRGGHQFYADSCGDILSIGSGASHFFEIVASSGIDRNMPPGLPSATTAVASWVGVALGEQMRRSGGLNFYYGGGFEIFCVQDRKIVPVPEMTFLFVDVQKNSNNDGVTIAVHPILKFCYYSDVLIARRISIIKTGLDDHAEVGQNEMFILSPIYRKITESEAAELKAREISMSSAFTGVYMHFTGAKQGKDVSFTGNYNPTQEPTLRFVETKAGLKIMFAAELIDKIKSTARTAYDL
jgi:hypothetical protein